MVCGESHTPFYSRVQHFINDTLEYPDKALDELRANNPIFYHRCYIRAFLNYSREDLDKMTIREFCDALAVVHELKKYWHLPFRDKD